MLRSICYGVLLTLTMNSCSVASNQQQPDMPVQKLNLNSTGAAINKIAFLTFRITSVDSVKDLYDVKLVNTIFSDGTLKKKGSVEETVIEPGYLYYQISGEGSNEKVRHYEKVENPLARIFEYPSEDGLAKKVINQKTGELVIRFQYDESAKSISIFKPDQHTLKLKPLYYATL